MQLADAITIIDKSRNADGYLKVRARSAKAGIYDYLGIEIDPEGKKFKPTDTVKVYRPADEVFDKASLASFIGRPITDNHPTEAVNATNWRDHARGAIFGAVKDGDYVGFDLAFMDAATIASIENGKCELSNGYACDLSIEDGVTDDGTAYQAVQRNIRGNHCALVDRGRAGPECRVTDAQQQRWAVCDANPAALSSITTKEDRVKVNNLDGLSVNITDGQAVEQALTALDGKLTKALADAAEVQKAHDKALATKDAEIDDLKTKVVDQAQIDALADAKATVVADAKKIAGDKLGDTAGKSVADVRKMAVAAKLGDAAVADKSDDYIEARFDGLKDGAPNTIRVPDGISNPQITVDAEQAFADQQRKLSEQRRNAWKNPASAAVQ